MTVVKMGSPAVPVKITATKTRIAKLDHIWRAARRYAKRHGYRVVETYGVPGVAPFCERTVEAWLGYLQIPCKSPIHCYEIFDRQISLVAEWSVE